MKRSGRRGVVMCLMGGILSCGTDRRPEGAAAESPPRSSRNASPQHIAELQEKFPVLGSAPAPAPRPLPDADPRRVPERYQDAVPPRVLEAATGGATFYADHFEGRRTASGIPFRQNQLVAAHRGFPFGTLLRVTNLGNGRTVNVRVVDRGPFGDAAAARRTIIDLSRRAAARLGYTDTGRAEVRVEVLEWGDGLPTAS